MALPPRKKRVEHYTKLPPKRIRFLRAFAACGCVRRAAAVSRTPTASHYAWLRDSKKYRRAFDRAHRRAGYLKQAVLDRLAMVGQPKFHEGRPLFEYFDADGEPCAGDEVVYRDAAGRPCEEDAPGAVRKPRWVRRTRVYDVNVTALIVALKSAFPDRYRERREVKHTGVPKPSPVNEQIRQILADRDLTERANDLARRLAIHAGGNGQSAN